MKRKELQGLHAQVNSLKKRVWIIENPSKYILTEDVWVYSELHDGLVINNKIGKVANVRCIYDSYEYYWRYDVFIDGIGVVKYVQEHDLSKKQRS